MEQSGRLNFALNREAFPQLVGEPNLKRIGILLLCFCLAICGCASPSSGEIPEEAVPLVNAAVEDLAARLSLSRDEITVEAVQQKTWNDSSLGCPAPGGFYAEMRTSGYRIVLRANGELFAYHAADGGQSVQFCEADQP